MSQSAKALVDEHDGEQPVRGFVHDPEKPSGGAVVLTHGAGGDCRSPLLVALAQHLSAMGLTVLRFDLPFRQMRPHGPPSPASAARDQDGIRRAVAVMHARCGGRLVAGGQSYGGRQVTLAAADNASLADALLLLSYPLHPPGQPARPRTAHFGRLRVPSLFISGTRDPFGTVEELAAAVALIPARTRFVQIPGAAHTLMTRRNADSVPGLIAQRLAEFVLLPRSPQA
jgi:predicted alpha/beta-hydrolase family hydrolase